MVRELCRRTTRACSPRKFDHIVSLLLCDYHWLRVMPLQWIVFKLAELAFRCLDGIWPRHTYTHS